MNPPPPGPATNGIVTPMVLAAATAASMALPPCFSTWIAAALACRLIEAAPPPVPTATGSFLITPIVWALAGAERDEALARDGRTDTATATAEMTQTADMRRMGTSVQVGLIRPCFLMLREKRVKPPRRARSQSVNTAGVSGPDQL